MIPNDEKEDWHYLAVKKLYPLLHGITFKTENKLKSHEKVCKNKDFCGIVMPSKKNYILEFNQYMKSDKMSYVIYADIQSLFMLTLNLYLKKQMDVQVIQKNLQQQNLVNIFQADF